jgi:methylated-DNA-protein-cysteine methyltransferase related protein
VNRNERVWQVVKRIPRGKVATYGQIAELATLCGRSAARHVGYALSALTDGTKIPWQRVINKDGKVSPRGDPDRPEYQRILLESEGVEFGLSGIVDLQRYRWRPSIKKVRAD